MGELLSWHQEDEQNNAFAHWFTYFVIIAWLCFVGIWLHRMNEALGLYDPLFIIPLLQSNFIFFAIISGGIYFREFRPFKLGNWLGFWSGVTIMFSGLYLMSPDPSDKEGIDRVAEVLVSPRADPDKPTNGSGGENSANEQKVDTMALAPAANGNNTESEERERRLSGSDRRTQSPNGPAMPLPGSLALGDHISRSLSKPMRWNSSEEDESGDPVDARGRRPSVSQRKSAGGVEALQADSGEARPPDGDDEGGGTVPVASPAARAVPHSARVHPQLQDAPPEPPDPVLVETSESGPKSP